MQCEKPPPALKLCFAGGKKERFDFTPQSTDTDALTGYEPKRTQLQSLDRGSRASARQSRDKGEILSMSVVTVDRQDAIAIVRIDNPPVNALSGAVRAGLQAAIEEVGADASIQGVVLIGAGKFFIAGADITEFGRPPIPPILPDVTAALEALDKPVVAAIRGAALGGGLEVALACSDRIASQGTKLGLPETGLGVLPGSGGTQRTPRLIGLKETLSLVTSGRRIDADEALDLGLIDAVCDDEGLLEAAKQRARSLVGTARRRTGSLPNPADDPEALAQYRAKHQADRPGQFALSHAVEAVAASVELPFADGMKRERELFMECIAGPERAALIHAFFADRRAAKVPEASTGQALDVKTVGVIGGGTMGAGIASAMLLNGLKVAMVERDRAAADQGRANVEKILNGSVQRGKLTAEKRDGLLRDAFHASDDYGALSNADLVVEAVFESMEVKRAVFTELDRVCKPGAVLATNTSYLDINDIAAVTGRPEAVIGLHFFSPAHVMKLLEIVVADKTGPDAVATGVALAKKLRKIAVRAGVCDGFIGNRILAVYRQSADYMMLDGASPYQIDRAVRGFGFPMGPYQVSDLAGLDIGWATRKRRAATRDPQERYVAVLDRICERDWFGRKSGRGLYRYDDGNPKGNPDPEVEAIIDTEREANGIAPRDFSDEEIISRYMAAMVNEAAKVVEEGIALRPSDVDVTLLYGYGFPRFRGGPLHYADTVGLKKILGDIERYAKEDDFFWRPSLLLQDLVSREATFDSLNTED